MFFSLCVCNIKLAQFFIEPIQQQVMLKINGNKSKTKLQVQLRFRLSYAKLKQKSYFEWLLGRKIDKMLESLRIFPSKPGNFTISIGFTLLIIFGFIDLTEEKLKAPL